MIPVLPINYFPPISYFVVLAQNDTVLIEQHEHFIKQSFRNRMEIFGVNGKLSLTIPLHRKSREKKMITDVSIANDTPWQAHHWKSIANAYRATPYFEYYEDKLLPLFLNEQNNLWDFNLQITHLLMGFLGLQTKIEFTNDFDKNIDYDFRNSFSAKAPQLIDGERYIQTFEEKIGFLNDLSILDALFNMGPETLSYLKQQKLNVQHK